MEWSNQSGNICISFHSTHKLSCFYPLLTVFCKQWCVCVCVCVCQWGVLSLWASTPSCSWSSTPTKTPTDGAEKSDRPKLKGWHDLIHVSPKPKEVFYCHRAVACGNDSLCHHRPTQLSLFFKDCNVIPVITNEQRFYLNVFMKPLNNCVNDSKWKIDSIVLRLSHLLIGCVL